MLQSRRRHGYGWSGLATRRRCRAEDESQFSHAIDQVLFRDRLCQDSGEERALTGRVGGVLKRHCVELLVLVGCSRNDYQT